MNHNQLNRKQGMSKKQWLIEVVETREVICEYLVEGDTLEAAKESAINGETLREKESKPSTKVVNRTIWKCYNRPVVQRHLRVEYDPAYNNQVDYKGNTSKFVYIPLEGLDGNNEVHKKFIKLTGYNAQCIIHWSWTEEYDAYGNLLD